MRRSHQSREAGVNRPANAHARIAQPAGTTRADRRKLSDGRKGDNAVSAWIDQRDTDFASTKRGIRC